MKATAIAILKDVLREGSINSDDRVCIEKAIKELDTIPKEKLICLKCGKPFERLRSQILCDKVYCSQKCYRASNGGRAVYNYVCINCSKSFSIYTRKTGKRVFCTRKCMNDYRRSHPWKEHHVD